MSFDIAAFVRTNRIIFIWTAFAALLYLFRSLFGLVFITFIMCFVTHSVTRPLEKHLKVNRRLLVVLVYVIFLVGFGLFLFFLFPTLIGELQGFTGQIAGAVWIIEDWIEQISLEHDWLIPAVDQLMEQLTLEQLVMRGWNIGRALLEKGIQYFIWFFLGLMFSFLIMLDLPHMARSVRNLSETRLSGFYQEVGGSVLMFAKAVGENFRAQIIISAMDALMMAIGLTILGVHNVVLLSTLVFFCGLIPVLGVILSSVPIFLMAVNSGGMVMGLGSIGLIIITSLIETYILNPRIVSSVMRMNPVFTLIILFIAYSLFGIWGMLLGVPVSVYIYRQIMLYPGQVPEDDKNKILE